MREVVSAEQETTTGITTSKAVENRTKEIKSSIVDNL